MHCYTVKQNSSQKTEDVLYRLGWISIGILSIGVFAVKLFPNFFSKLAIPCVFHAMTGYYCPGCGGTRAVGYLLTGHLIKSFIYHPLIAYVGIGGTVFMVSHTLQVLSKGKIKGMKFRNGYVYGMLIILIVQFVLKNALVYFWGYRII